jgi:acyl transferase domain-containing protein/NADPH:quinone reductase-like Zn-dependent oxidoreductase/acyl carrier protein/NADP-dependent 3-hydroxy acid dehydrogenase YdfG
MDHRIAIIGYACRLPGCADKDLWQALLNGEDLVSEVEDARWSKQAWQHPDSRHPGSSLTFAAGSLGDVSGFDAAFFGLSPREVSHMDPQQRLLLEMSWEAMERAGIPPVRLRGSNTGVFIGIASVDYAYRYADDLAAIDANTGTGTASSIASNRISYLFDLHGPSISMDTACSSSLVAFHQACQAIRNGETDMALTGGISLHLHPFGFMVFSKANMLSPDGRCKVFDAEGNGYVRSEGGGVFLLKRYDQALADGDPILAVVAASAVNTDGAKQGLTVPNPAAQSTLMQRACAQAGITPEQIDYLEAHGTGTAVGDPIETRAIGEALGLARSRPLPIGSIKSNLGHLETASGVAGLVKALLILEHRMIPPMRGPRLPNPNIRFDEWNLKLVQEPQSLSAQGALTVAVNSFGFGGANAHVILQSAEAQATRVGALPERPAQPLPLCLSARSGNALKAQAEQLAGWIEKQQPDLYDLCWTLRKRRQTLDQGWLLWLQTPEQAVDALHAFAAGESVQGGFGGRHVAQQQGPVWVYSGNGCQWHGMGKQLLAQSPIVREAVAEVSALLARYDDQLDLLELLTEPPEHDPFGRTELAQPALFALQVGITRQLQAQGIQPAVVIGHSVGEVAAAWASGALTLEQAVQVIYQRSHYQGLTAGQGQMTAVAATVEQVSQWLDELDCPRVSIAGINSPSGVTLAGAVEEMERIEARLREEGVRFKRLGLDYAFHSPSMDSIAQPLKAALATLEPGHSRVPFISTVSGDEVPGTSLDAEYWWRNVREPVLFAPAIEHCLQRGCRTFVEIGSHPVLRGYVNEALRAQQHAGVVIATLSRQQDSVTELERVLAELLLSGARLDESHWFPVAGRVLALPTYPWQRQRFWRPTTRESLGMLERHPCHPLLGYAVPQHPGCWETQLDTARFPWLADHQVGDGVVFPGAGYVEMLLAAACAQSSEQDTAPKVLELEELEIRSPLLLEENTSRVVRTRLAIDTGALCISSRPHAQDGDWQEHVRARWFAGCAGRLLKQPAIELPAREPDFCRAEHLAAAAAIGLDYGPAFQAIRHGWLEGNSVIGQFELNDAILASAEGMLLHPGVLDSALQLFVPLLARDGGTDGAGYVPVQVERVQLDLSCIGVLAERCRVTLHKRTPQSLLADILLQDAVGHTLAVLEGVRLRRIQLKRGARAALNRLDMALVPCPLLGSPSPLENVELHLALAPVLAVQGNNRLATELEPLLDTFALAAMHEVLSAQRYRPESMPEATREWYEQGLSRGLLRLDDEGCLAVVEPPEVKVQPLWEMLVREYPDAFAAIHAVGRFGLALAGWIEGTAPLPAYDSGQASSLYRVRWDAQLLQHLEQRLAEALQGCQQSLAAGQKLTLVECSASEMQLLPTLAFRLAGVDTELCLLSASETEVGEARAQLRHWPQAHAVHWDGSVLPAVLGEPDLVLVHLDWQRPSQVRQLLQQLAARMRPGAYLLLLGHPPSLWLEQLTVGEEALRAAEGTLIPDVNHWQRLLTGLGFEQVTWLGDEQQPAASFIISARAGLSHIGQDSEPQPWLVLADADLQSWVAAWQQAELAQIESMTSPAALLTRARQCAENGQTPRLLWLSGLQPEQPSLERCLAVRDICVALERAGVRAEVVVVTTGLTQTWLDQAPLPAPQTVVEQAMFWGFARTLANELNTVRLCRLDMPSSLVEFGFDQMRALLEVAASEDEQGLTADGVRYVPRLQEVSTASTQEGETLRLGFDQPGQLRQLRWQVEALPALGEYEVQVKVRATGLNFRDVMYALGLLSDEAIENGFTGPGLGLEFAGVVEAVGAQVDDFRPGDAVVGFAAASFSTRLVTTRDTLAPLPVGLDFAAAATIPTTFFTVYYALKQLAQVQPGERVLIHGAAGGVGLAAIQIARLLGAEVLVTVGSPAKRDVMRLLGIERIYDSRSHRFAEEILADLGEGVDVVLNSLAGEAIRQNLRVLKPFGRFIELGKRDFYENTTIGLRPFRNNLSYFGVDSDQLMKVKPVLTRQLFREMMQYFEQGELSPLPYTAFAADRVVDAFRFMQQARQIGKVVVEYRRAPQAQAVTSPVSKRLELPDERTWLVTGGLAGFGLRVAQWLVDRGARQLVLLSRRGQPDAGSQVLIDQWKAAGVQVQALACDVSDRAALAEVLARVRKTLPPLGGVFHAAARFEDGLAANLDAQQMRSVFDAKALAARYLHELTADQPLEHFVLFSSATTLFGNPGQANYVGANLALEALAQWRRTQGLPATCIRMGAIEDVGYLARHAQVRQALQNRMGGRALTADQALQALEAMLVEDIALQGVMDFDWAALARFLPRPDVARYSWIARAQESEVAAGGDDDLRQQLLTMPEQERHARVVRELASSLGRILMLPAEQIDPEQSVYDLGFDSLMGVELITAIEERFGVSLPAMAISEAPTLNQLAQRLLDRIVRADADADAELDEVAQVAVRHGVDHREVTQA